MCPDGMELEEASGLEGTPMMGVDALRQEVNVQFQVKSTGIFPKRRKFSKKKRWMFQVVILFFENKRIFEDSQKLIRQLKISRLSGAGNTDRGWRRAPSETEAMG